MKFLSRKHKPPKAPSGNISLESQTKKKSSCNDIYIHHVGEDVSGVQKYHIDFGTEHQKKLQETLGGGTHHTTKTPYASTTKLNKIDSELQSSWRYTGHKVNYRRARRHKNHENSLLQKQPFGQVRSDTSIKQNIPRGSVQ